MAMPDYIADSHSDADHTDTHSDAESLFSFRATLRNGADHSEAEVSDMKLRMHLHRLVQGPLEDSQPNDDCNDGRVSVPSCSVSSQRTQSENNDDAVSVAPSDPSTIFDPGYISPPQIDNVYKHDVDAEAMANIALSTSEIMTSLLKMKDLFNERSQMKEDEETTTRMQLVIDSTPERVESMRQLHSSQQFAKVGDVFKIILEATHAHGLLFEKVLLLMRQTQSQYQRFRHAEERHSKVKTSSTCKRLHEERSSSRSKRQCIEERASSICQQNHEEGFHSKMCADDEHQIAKEELIGNQEETKAMRQEQISEVHKEANSPRPHYKYPRYEPIKTTAAFCAKCSVPWDRYNPEFLPEKKHSSVIKEFLFYQNPRTDEMEVSRTWIQEPRRIINLAASIANVDETDKTVVMLKEVLVHLIHSRSMGLNENASATMFCMKYHALEHDTTYLEVGCLSCARLRTIPLDHDFEFNGFVRDLVDILKPESST